ncbi:MAG: fumarylacetoacetate hydrolase family protein [Gemmatimonadota bacterium]|nr:fumarylacetoacetate hydrolase family protein [Gemmatimonadota bacterium]
MIQPSKIVCVGRNYLEHAKELGNEVPERPLIFLKPPSALIGPGQPILLPPQSSRVEHEAEIGVVLGRQLRNVSVEEAELGIGGIVCANDVTARDLQGTDGQWTRAKGFDTFCPVGPIQRECDWRELEIICRVNGTVRQHGRSSEMAFSIPTLLAYISTVMTLMPGDLVLTGTPAGVSPLAEGDSVEVEIPGVGILQNPVRLAA